MIAGPDAEKNIAWDSPALQYTWAGVIVAVGIVITLSGFIFVQRWVEYGAAHAFNDVTTQYATEVQETLTRQLDVLDSVVHLYAASEFVLRDEFRSFAEGLLANRPTIQALEWIPRVAAEARKPYEARARKDGVAEYSFTERDALGTLIPAGVRDIYFPVYYVVPQAGNEKALGFDLASDPARLAALNNARNTGGLAVSGRIKLIQETGEQSGFVAFLPIFRKGEPRDTPRQRVENLDGFALGVFRIGSLVETALTNLGTPPAGLDIYLFDQGGAPGAQFLYFHPSRTREGGTTAKSEDAMRREAHASATVSVGDRQWEIVFAPIPGYFEAQAPWLAWVVLATGLLFTGLLTAYLVSAAGRESRIRFLVRQRTDELALSEHRTRAIVDNVIDGIVTIDQRGIIQTVNPAVEAMFGHSAQDLVGVNVRVLAAEPHRGAHDGYLAKYLETGEAKVIGRTRELEGHRRDGERFPVELDVAELVIEGERLFVGVLRDISQRKEMERMKNEFISTVSHELRTPLTSIRGSLGLITGGTAGEIPQQAMMMVDLAAKNTERLISLVNDILDIEKIESGLMEFHFGRLDVTPLVHQVVETCHGYAEEHGITFAMTRSEDETWVRGDGDRLTQVVANLLSNAAKFSPRGGTVEISVERLDGTVRIAVSDRGPGISEEYRPRIFERFSQGDSSDTRTKGGTGLGLNITRAIVERHSGQISFDTELGVGTTFRVDLPLSREVERKVPDGGLEALSKGARILICEDDPGAADLISAILERSGFHTDVAADGAKAKKMLAAKHYDAMTVDIVLPDQDGISLIRDVRRDKKTKNMAIVVVSGKATEVRNEVVASTMGIVDWLDKPIDQNQLLTAVKRAARNQTDNFPRLLYVEDDDDLVRVVSALLDSVAEVVAASTLTEARKHIENERFDLAVIDVDLPDGSGLDLLTQLGDGGSSTTPIIIFSADQVDASTAAKVEAALIKSQTSDRELVETIKSLIAANVKDTAAGQETP